MSILFMILTTGMLLSSQSETNENVFLTDKGYAIVKEFDHSKNKPYWIIHDSTLPIGEFDTCYIQTKLRSYGNATKTSILNELLGLSDELQILDSTYIMTYKSDTLKQPCYKFKITFKSRVLLEHIFCSLETLSTINERIAENTLIYSNESIAFIRLDLYQTEGIFVDDPITLKPKIMYVVLLYPIRILLQDL